MAEASRSKEASASLSATRGVSWTGWESGFQTQERELTPACTRSMHSSVCTRNVHSSACTCSVCPQRAPCSVYLLRVPAACRASSAEQLGHSPLLVPLAQLTPAVPYLCRVRAGALGTPGGGCLKSLGAQVGPTVGLSTC